MTYDLFLGDRLYSSWSIRGWVMFAAFDIPCRNHFVGLYTGRMADDLAPLAPAHPKAGLWPADPAQRATARWLVTEMVAGFHALRTDCPMQLSHVWEGFQPSKAILADQAASRNALGPCARDLRIRHRLAIRSLFAGGCVLQARRAPDHRV